MYMIIHSAYHKGWRFEISAHATQIGVHFAANRRGA